MPFMNELGITSEKFWREFTNQNYWYSKKEQIDVKFINLSNFSENLKACMRAPNRRILQLKASVKILIEVVLEWQPPTWSSENLSEWEEIDPELSVSPGLLSEDFLFQGHFLFSITKSGIQLYLIKEYLSANNCTKLKWNKPQIHKLSHTVHNSCYPETNFYCL